METPQGWPIGMVQVIKTGEEIPRKFFKKALDKLDTLCYNKDTKREGNLLKKEKEI